MNMLFETNDEIKRSRCDKIIHKDMIVNVDIFETNKSYLLQFYPKMNFIGICRSFMDTIS